MIEESSKYKKIGEKLIRTRKAFRELKESGVRIAYLVSDEEKKQNHKIVFADCSKVNKRYFWCCPYDFMITVYEQNCLWFSDKQFEILINHELRHCGIDNNGVETKFYVVPHDIEEFREIIDKYGLDWSVENAKRR